MDVCSVGQFTIPLLFSSLLFCAFPLLCCHQPSSLQIEILDALKAKTSEIHWKVEIIGKDQEADCFENALSSDGKPAQRRASSE